MARADAVPPKLAELLTFDGQVAVVTGAGRGLGRSIAMRFAEAQASVVVGYRTSAAAAQALVAEISAAEGWTQPIRSCA